MRVARIGFTPVKGGRHLTHPAVSLTRGGPQGDRRFCLVDLAAGRCLRTVHHPTLLQTSAVWDWTVLSVALPSGVVEGTPVATGEVHHVDYWGRSTAVEVVAGPWAAAYSAHLGREVVLVSGAPGDLVYGGPVTLVTSASLARLADEVGAPVDAARFRATFELDGGELDPDAEQEWVGRRVRIGVAEVRVRGVVPRCAVVDVHPETGVRDLALLSSLADRRSSRGEPVFGVDAEVTVPGRIHAGDVATVVPG
ncbi:MOSC domain-containing protein [Nocardioides euryhalodurans]|uniref:MOSC domain-containing protein n=1 Tax=Nocardioides euryhalodurans TaxID=2518370 RepID=A0A4V1BE23_9ACTN|nr:MOSC domain-containing protein [Nocardioides euryhalodurans]QBR93122.1 MOSC domain-containing protein [Nocardioides euryhalodurans]